MKKQRIDITPALGVLLLVMINFTNLVTARSASRAKEICLRKIFGAPVSGMLWMQSWEFSKWILLSVMVAGLFAYLAAKNWLNGFAYHFNPGIGILLVTVITNQIIATFTVGYQSLKAAKANPVDSLRHD